MPKEQELTALESKQPLGEYGIHIHCLTTHGSMIKGPVDLKVLIFPHAQKTKIGLNCTFTTYESTCISANTHTGLAAMKH